MRFSIDLQLKDYGFPRQCEPWLGMTPLRGVRGDEGIAPPTDGLSRCVCATGGTPKNPAAIIGIAAGMVRLSGFEPLAFRLGVTVITHTSLILALHDSRSTPNYTVFKGAISSFSIVDTPLYLLVFRSAISKMLAVLQRSQNLNQLVRF